MKMYLSTIHILMLAGISFASVQDCIKGASHLYTGTHSATESGRTCQRWDVNMPHEVKKVPEDGGHHNYCRNPDKDSRGTWCYTTDPATRWEYCKIPKCDDQSLLVWTSNDDRDDSAFFQYAKADPEIMMQGGKEADVELYRKVFKNSQLGALAVDSSGEEIFFIDAVNDYLGVFNTKSLKVERFLEGEASNIRAISQDFVTGNIYWTDAKTKSVMVADKSFKSKIAIYNSAPFEPQAVAVLPFARKLVFSTFAKVNTKIRGAQIVMTDMSGGNAKILFKSPDVVDVTGLAVDDKRIYWTDSLGYASRVMSCLFDGSDKKQHYFKKMASFEDIAVYSNYIYVTDSRQRYNYFDHIRYHIDVITKDSDQIFTYTKPDQPHGIAILRKMKDLDFSSVKGSSKNCKKRCGGGICLTNARGVYSCHCPVRQRFQKITGLCVPIAINGKFEGGDAIKKKARQ